jgi:hypothetical protein
MFPVNHRSDAEILISPPSLDVTKAKYSISRLSVVEKQNVVIRINPSNFVAHEQEINIMMKIKITVNLHTQIQSGW